MSPDSAKDLQAAFAARPIREEASEETLMMVWDAVSGTASPSDLVAVLERVRREPAVAEAWRVACSVRSELVVEEASEKRAPSDSSPVKLPSNVVRGPAHWWQGPAGMGVGIVMAVAASMVMYVVPVSQERVDTVMRADVVQIENKLLYAGLVERENAVLRWTALPKGTVYTVTVTTDVLAPVDRAGALNEAEWVIPAATLSGLPDDTVLLWRVEATLPDGSKHRSATFDVVLR